MLKRLLVTLTLGAVLAPAAVAQTGSLTGTVIDAETEETIPGVNVKIAGLQRGAATDANGAYTIQDIPVGEYTLRASFVGYQSFETEITIEANSQQTQNIRLQYGAVGLDEVVVTGYGQQQTAGEVSGSIARVGTEDIENVPVQSTEGLLQGRAAGVTVSTTSGNPGGGFSVDIRGRGSINAGSRPLYIVDGVQVSFSQNSELSDRSPLNAINPDDIESIEVLKDAAAASIYGAQAANGVVLITTKSGREGDTQVSVNFEGGARYQSQRFDMMNRDEYLDFQVDAFGEESVRNGILPAYGYDPNTPFSELRDFEWQDWLFEPGSHTEMSFTASGGDEDTQFYLSGNWTDTGGALQSESVGYNQYNFRANLNQRFTDDLTVDTRVTLNNEDSENVCQDGFFINCPFYQSVGEEPPISYPYLNNGEYNPNTEQSSTTNPALFLNEETREVTTTQIIVNLSPEYTITQWLTARGKLGVDWQQQKENDYESPTRAPSEGGTLSRRFATTTNLTGNLRLDADYTFGDSHNVSGIVGSEYRREHEAEDETGVQGFNNRLLRVPAAASETSFFQGFNTEYRILSYFGRANYNYGDRYIANLTARYDGTSRFGADRRWGFFPSGSVAWRLSEEDFFTVGAVDDLKVRLSYGVTGNSDIGNFAARGLFDASGSYDGQVGIRPDQLANQRLTWEENREINFGVDWSMWGGRFTGNADLYRSISDELLLDRPLPQSSGYNSITENVGQVQNRGVEFSVRTVNVQTESLRWSTRFNMGVTQNEVKDLNEGADALNSGETLPVAVGQPIEAWRVPVWAGVNPADGRPMYYDEDGNLTYETSLADRQFLDGAEEDVSGGFGTRLSYGGLSLDVFFDFQYGATSLPFTQTTWSIPFGEGVHREFHTDRWREPGDVEEWPRAEPFGSFDNADGYGWPGSQWLRSSNYVRLKNATLSYNLPSSVLDAIGLSGARVYTSGVNLITWTSYLGLDPEVEDEFEESSYPAEQQINFGIELDL
jgi:TonB-linked SusC/RagA family outer membrane protein